jgi:putative photosynthetic complex assembly protein 2
MLAWLAPLAFATVAWFVGTGAVLWLDRLPARTRPGSLMAATVVAGFATAAILVCAQSSAPAAAYIGFAATVALWGWHEASFLLGFVSGPRREACPEDARGWARFRLATATLIHHEIALAVTAVALFAITWNAPNQIAGWTFLLMFGLRLSTKLNIFLGVPHLSADMMPPHLDYLKSYFGAARSNALIPYTALAAIALVLLLGSALAAAPGGSGSQAAFGLLFALALLGLVEHAFLVLPVRDGALWGWAIHLQKPVD